VTALLNIDAAKVGGLRILKIGRFTFCFAISREFRPIGAGSEERKARREWRMNQRLGKAWSAGFRAAQRPAWKVR